MINRREMMSGTAAAAFAALIAGGASPLSRAEALPAARQGHDRVGGNFPIESLMREPLSPSLSHPILDVITLEVPPGASSSPHQHTGQVFAYILEGEIENQVEPGPPKRYGPGSYFYEPPMHEHKMMKNLSETKPAKLLIFQVEQKGKPFTIPWNGA